MTQVRHGMNADGQTPGKVNWWQVGAVFLIPLLLFVGLWLSMLFSEAYSHWRSAGNIERLYQERLLPAAEFVRAFHEREHRLPTDAEMEMFNKRAPDARGVGIHRSRLEWVDGWGVEGKDFIVCTSIGEWNLFYHSWNGERRDIWTD